MGSLQHIILPVQGQLDTAMPVSNRAPGTVVEAVEGHPLYIGPRPGFTQQTWPYESSASFPNSRTLVFNGNTSYAVARMHTKQQYNLGTAWTIDVVFRPTSVTHSADAEVPVFVWALFYNTGPTDPFDIRIALQAGGAAAADQRKVVAYVTTTSAPGTLDVRKLLSGTSQLSVGTTIDKTHHVRLARNLQNIYLYVDGTLEDSYLVTGTSRTEAPIGPSSTYYGQVYLGADTSASGGNHYFNGRIYAASLRSGFHTDVTKGWRDWSFTTHPSCHFAVTGNNFTTGADVEESSVYKSVIHNSNVTVESVSQPAPWQQSRVQGGTFFVDRRGRSWNYVLSGGTLFWRRVY